MGPDLIKMPDQDLITVIAAVRKIMARETRPFRLFSDPHADLFAISENLKHLRAVGLQLPPEFEMQAAE